MKKSRASAAFRTGILVCSTSSASGKRSDESGKIIRRFCGSRLRAEVKRFEIVPDSKKIISGILRRWSDRDRLDLILTTGGTGFSPTDVTPEATRMVLHREAPQLAAAVLWHGLKKTPMAMISRAAAGLRRRTLIINLPGSPGGVRDGLAILAKVLPHVLEVARGLHQGVHARQFSP